MEPANAFIVGEKVTLRPLRDDDADGPYPSWLNDAEVCAGNSHHVYPYGKEQALEYIRGTRGRRDLLVLAIVVSKDGQERHIGNMSLQSIDHVWGSAEFAVLIGDRTAWGQGYGKEAARLLFQHAFRTLNLHRVHCGTFDSNTGMRRLAAHLGMREEGRRREAAFRDGRYVDIVEFGVLRSEFEARWPVPTAR
jgi:RimJ/RimL family protein N-acetyltransferase